MKIWFVLSASPCEHWHQGWRRHLYEVHAEVRSACRDNLADDERRDPQLLQPGPWKNVLFVLSCLQSSSGEWLSRAQKAAWQKLQLRGYPEELLPADHEEILQQNCHKVRASHRGRGIHLAGSAKQGKSHSYIWIYLYIHIWPSEEQRHLI